MIKIKPTFMGRTPWCSCYESVTGNTVGDCPRWDKERKVCEIGGGTIIGKTCAPAVHAIVDHLIQSTKMLEDIGVGKKPLDNDLHDLIAENREALNLPIKTGRYIDQDIEQTGFGREAINAPQG